MSTHIVLLLHEALQRALHVDAGEEALQRRERGPGRRAGGRLAGRAQRLQLAHAERRGRGARPRAPAHRRRRAGTCARTRYTTCAQTHR